MTALSPRVKALIKEVVQETLSSMKYVSKKEAASMLGMSTFKFDKFAHRVGIKPIEGMYNAGDLLRAKEFKAYKDMMKDAHH